jgi:hypothetical protein
MENEDGYMPQLVWKYSQYILILVTVDEPAGKYKIAAASEMLHFKK